MLRVLLTTMTTRSGISILGRKQCTGPWINLLKVFSVWEIEARTACLLSFWLCWVDRRHEAELCLILQALIVAILLMLFYHYPPFSLTAGAHSHAGVFERTHSSYDQKMALMSYEQPTPTLHKILTCWSSAIYAHLLLFSF